LAVTPPLVIHDGESYHSYAVNLLEYGVFGIGEKATARVSPGISLVLALAYKIFGIHYWVWILCLQALGVATCCLIADTARRIFGIPAGMIAGFLAAIYPQFLYLAITTDGRSLSIFGLCLASWCLVKEWETSRKRWLLYAGMALGGAYLGRVQLLLFPAFLPLWAWARYRNRRDVLPAVAWVALGLFLAMGGWTVRNYLTFGIFMPGGTEAGYAFASINNEKNFRSGRNRGQVMMDTAPAVFSPESRWVDPAGQWSREFMALTDQEKNHEFTKATWEWILHNPEKFVIHAAFKLKALWISGQNHAWPWWARPSNILLYGVCVMPAALYGMFQCLQKEPEKMAPFSFWLVLALYTTLLHVLFEGEIRHRSSFEPGILILAGYGWQSLWPKISGFLPGFGSRPLPHTASSGCADPGKLSRERKKKL